MMYLDEPTLGTLVLGPQEGVDLPGACEASPFGYVVSQFQIGFPTVRAVARNRALSDGTYDDSKYVGSRAISVTIVLNDRAGDSQLLVDALMPYLSPRYRPRLYWSIPGSTEVRSAIVRGADAPLSITRKAFNGIVASWVAVDGYAEGDQECLTIVPSADTEAGRTYDLDFDRTYPPSLPIGDRLILNRGNAPADWVGTIFGPADNPAIVVNGIDMRFDQGGGLTVGGGQSLVISTRDKTMLLNGDPADSRYDKSNYTDWTWDEMRLLPGDNRFRFEGDVLGDAASLTVCWSPRFM